MFLNDIVVTLVQPIEAAHQRDGLTLLILHKQKKCMLVGKKMSLND